MEEELNTLTYLPESSRGEICPSCRGSDIASLNGALDAGDGEEDITLYFCTCGIIWLPFKREEDDEKIVITMPHIYELAWKGDDHGHPDWYETDTLIIHPDRTIFGKVRPDIVREALNKIKATIKEAISGSAEAGPMPTQPPPDDEGFLTLFGLN